MASWGRGVGKDEDSAEIRWRCNQQRCQQNFALNVIPVEIWCRGGGITWLFFDNRNNGVFAHRRDGIFHLLVELHRTRMISSVNFNEFSIQAYINQVMLNNIDLCNWWGRKFLANDCFRFRINPTLFLRNHLSAKYRAWNYFGGVFKLWISFLSSSTQKSGTKNYVSINSVVQQ